MGFSRYGIGEGAAAPSILGHEARDDELDEPVERAGLPLMASWRAEPGGSEGGTLRRRREPPAMAAEMGAAGGGNGSDGELVSDRGRRWRRRLRMEDCLRAFWAGAWYWARPDVAGQTWRQPG